MYYHIVMQSQIRLTIRPNNQITLTQGTWKKPLREGGYLLGEEKPDKYQLARFRKKGSKTTGNIGIEETFEEKLDRLFPPLDITKKSQRSKQPISCKLNSPKNFTRHSGQKVRESGAAVSIACGKEMRFAHEVTLTLPANTTSAFTALAAYSGYAINRLFQPIRRKYGEMCLWFFVWEYQKRGALHLHICVYHPDEMEGLMICSQLIEQWHKILVDISELSQTCLFTAKQGDRCTIRTSHQHHTSPIKKDVGAYFSKYAGKTESKDSWHVRKYPVSRFWGSSRSVKKIVKENSIQLDFDYQGNKLEADRKMSELMEVILSNCNVVSFSSYEFSISSQTKSTVRSYPKRGKIVNVVRGKPFSEGERKTFYIEREQLPKVLELMKQIEGCF